MKRSKGASSPRYERFKTPRLNLVNYLARIFIMFQVKTIKDDVTDVKKSTCTLDDIKADVGLNAVRLNRIEEHLTKLSKDISKQAKEVSTALSIYHTL